ncbi:MAG: hypothetical protein IPL36_09655 [Nigerium sp.]|nr:hypothetical protein [Nigerium sp.]
MTLRFTWDWEPAPRVRLPEQAATWCRLRIALGSTHATLVEQRDGSGGPRHGLDVSAYPLAEFLAINWWRLSTSSHLPTERGVHLVHAGAGFAWPDITLHSDHGLTWASLRQRDKAPEHVRFLTQTDLVLDSDAALSAIASFIDSTVRRLEDQGITGTLLQDEWAAIQHADQDERDFCLTAAAWGLDPYDIPGDAQHLLLDAEASIGNPALLADLSRAVPLTHLADSTRWLRDAIASLKPEPNTLPSVSPVDWSSATDAAPWQVGYERARELRSRLGLAPGRRAAVEDLLRVRETGSPAPGNVDALISADGSASLAVVVGDDTSPQAKRFVSARAIGRHSLSPIDGLSLLTRAGQYTERAERAFAAEFLAPAAGIAEVVDGDFSDPALDRAATHFQVSRTLVEHQVENQIAA